MHAKWDLTLVWQVAAKSWECWAENSCPELRPTTKSTFSFPSLYIKRSGSHRIYNGETIVVHLKSPNVILQYIVLILISVLVLNIHILEFN